MAEEEAHSLDAILADGVMKGDASKFPVFLVDGSAIRNEEF